ncbi:MAG: cupin [Gammaproteobacteria bacterium CG11_big_fil_rev_8_21_14_0_20_46_22]|nr:MAG: cupin [Gammaproteobacteria bacterium CG12_big_fil_rev_8_21_14_0_65_46_12]PIR11894.1 MAG: cupin [Gammaproteobacteria bacterium CG11_big_fil_rev_8_21_14_0_20_46_22]
MQTTSIPKEYEHTSPAGAEVRVLMSAEHGGIAHCTLKDKVVSKAVRHKTVSEFWHVLSGKGAIWRRNNHEEKVTPLEAGMTIDIPLGTDFQYRSDEGDLVFICVTMPPWSGADEASYVEQGAWKPTVK